MKTKKAVLAATGISAAVTAGAATPRVPGARAQEFIERVKQVPENASATAPWRGACQLGVEVVPPLLALLNSAEREVARNARRALQEVVRHAGRPGATQYARTVEAFLLEAVSSPATAHRADIVWLLSEIGERRSVPVLEKLLSDAELREDARCALVRTPGGRSVAALESAWKAAEGQWKFALAEALRARGREAPPSSKLTPTAQTEVKPKKAP